jgi:hypothetical protein
MMGPISGLCNVATLIKRSTRYTCSLHAKIDPPNATAAETVKIPFENVGETDTLESVVHNNAGP